MTAASRSPCRESYERWKDFSGEWRLVEGVLLFGGQHRTPDLNVLDNFYASNFELDGGEWPTVEHAFQAAKTHDPAWIERIRTAATPKESQRLGRDVPMSEDMLRRWREGGAVEAMRRALRAKFGRPELRQVLLYTGLRPLAEQVDDDPTWDDRRWGIGRDGVGENTSANNDRAVATASGAQTGPPRPTGNVVRRRADRPNSMRAAGHGGSSQTMLRLYTSDDTDGFQVDPLVVLTLSIVFILSVVGLHLTQNMVRWITRGK